MHKCTTMHSVPTKRKWSKGGVMQNLEVLYQLLQEGRIFEDIWSKSWNWPHFSKASAPTFISSYWLQVTSEPDQLYLISGLGQKTNQDNPRDSNWGNKTHTCTECPRLFIQKSDHKFSKTKDCRILFTWHYILQRSHFSCANPAISLQEAKMIVKCSAESKGESSYCNATWGYRFDSADEPVFLSANKLSPQHEQL